MTEGEIVFYLREVHSSWGATNLSSEKLGELEGAGLIERRTDPYAEVRLTPEGVRCKEASRASRRAVPFVARAKAKIKQHRNKKQAVAPRRWSPLPVG